MPASRWSSNPVDLFDWVGEEDSQLMDLLLPNIFTRLAQKNIEGKPGEQSGTDEMSKIPEILPILPLRGVVVFPQTAVPLTIGQPRSIKLVDDVVAGDKIIGLVASRNPDLENPGPEDLYRIGALAVVQRLLRAPDGTIRLLVQGLERIRIRRIHPDGAVSHCQSGKSPGDRRDWAGSGCSGAKRPRSI